MKCVLTGKLILIKTLSWKLNLSFKKIFYFLLLFSVTAIWKEIFLNNFLDIEIYTLCTVYRYMCNTSIVLIINFTFFNANNKQTA
jgi:hypothetical protein